MGKSGTGRTSTALALALSGVLTADFAEGVCLELVPWDLGWGRHREDEVVCGGVGICGLERERTNNDDR